MWALGVCLYMMLYGERCIHAVWRLASRLSGCPLQEYSQVILQRSMVSHSLQLGIMLAVTGSGLLGSRCASMQAWPHGLSQGRDCGAAAKTAVLQCALHILPWLGVVLFIADADFRLSTVMSFEKGQNPSIQTWLQPPFPLSHVL